MGRMFTGSFNFANHFKDGFQRMLDYTLKAEWDEKFVNELSPQVTISCEYEPQSQSIRLHVDFNRRYQCAYRVQTDNDSQFHNYEWMQYHVQTALKALHHGFFGLWFLNIIPDEAQRKAFDQMVSAGQIDAVLWTPNPENPGAKLGYDSLVKLVINGHEYREKISYAAENWKEVLANIIIRKE